MSIISDWRLVNLLPSQDVVAAIDVVQVQHSMLHASEIFRSPWSLIVEPEMDFVVHPNGMSPYLQTYVMSEEEYNSRVANSLPVPNPPGQMCFSAAMYWEVPNLYTPNVTTFSAANADTNKNYNLLYYKNYEVNIGGRLLYEVLYFIQR